MKTLSHWARLNPWKARLTIIFSNIILALLAMYVGSTLLTLSLNLPPILILIVTVAFLVAAFAYPSKSLRRSLSANKFYWRQKSCDLTLGVCGFVLICCLANQQSAPQHFTSAVSASSFVRDSVDKKNAAQVILASLSHRDKSTLTTKEKRILKREFKDQLKIYAKAKITGKKKEGSDALLIILAIIGALGLLYLVAALACSVACAGSDFGGIAIAVLGVAGITWLLIIVIRAIKRRKEKREAPVPDPKMEP